MNPIRHRPGSALCVAVALLLTCGLAARGGDWPMWRHDPGRTAATQEALPEPLHLLWVRKLPALEPAWPHHADEGTLTFDVSYKPVVMGRQLFVGSSASHSLTAMDTETGAIRWRFYADGPIRFAPVAAEGRVFVGSDDGHLYGLDAADGKVLWQYRPGPSGRKVIGNGHLCGLWPVRGGAVLQEGVLYFGAGIWPFMGSFLCAVEAATGNVVWENSGEGTGDYREALSPSDNRGVRPSLYGCTPQGYFTIAAGRLVVPQGRNLPHVYDLKDGHLLYNEVRGMHPGHAGNQWFALAAGEAVLFSYPPAEFSQLDWHALDVASLQLAEGNPGSTAVTAPNGVFAIPEPGGALDCFEPALPFASRHSVPLNAQANTPGSYIKAGRNLYAADKDGCLLTVKDVAEKPAVEKGPPIPGAEVWDMLAADGKLFTVARDGHIACFGGAAREPKLWPSDPQATLPPAPAAAAAAVGSLAPGGATNEGYCVVLGLRDGALVRALLAQTRFSVIAVDSRAEKVDALRRAADAAGLYGSRLTAFVSSNLLDSGLPPSLANLVTSETLDAAAFLRRDALTELRDRTRPYGGRIGLAAGATELAAARAAVETGEHSGCTLAAAGDFLVLTRAAPLPGAANKTHSNGDAANTMMSDDDRVRPPFGVLWFGGPANDKILPRHGHGPSPQLCNGVLVVEGPNLLRAIDVYTGRLLWERDFPGIGKYFDTGGKQLGAHEIGDNYVCMPDGVYVLTPDQCLQLELNSGRTQREIGLPAGIEPGTRWGSIRADGDLLIATVNPLREGKPAVNGEASEWLAVFERRTGKPLWTRKADYSWGNVAVIAGNGRIFASDKYPSEKAAVEVRRGEPKGKTTLYAFEGQTGKELWKTEQNLFGAWLAYSARHDVLIQSGRGRCGPDPTGFVAVRGADGTRLWATEGQQGPPMLVGDTAVPQTGIAVNIADGSPATRTNPLTGTPFVYGGQAHGCSFNSASRHLVYMRAGGAHAGYQEVRNGFGISCLNGFRSSCTANATAGGGVLVYPDYTRDCRCQFENQTSLALVHMPEMEQWSFDFAPGAVQTTGPVLRVGLNCAGPGDRLDENGTLWVDCPAINGPLGTFADYLPTSVDSAARLRCHPSRISGAGIPWVQSSALIGATHLQASLSGAGRYTVRLYFAELDPAVRPGDRRFDVTVQGEKKLADLDIVKEAGAPRVGIVREFGDVLVEGNLQIRLTPITGRTLICGVEAIASKTKGD